MKVIIAGSRGITNKDILEKTIEDSEFNITEVVCGCASGVDTLGKEWAISNNIPVIYFSAKWDIYGKSAGYRRNAEMANYADALIVIWDNKSKGTKHMIDLANKNGLYIYIEKVKD